MRPDYDASGDSALQRSKRSRTDITVCSISFVIKYSKNHFQPTFAEGCYYGTQSFRAEYCTQGAIIDYGIASNIISIAGDMARAIKQSCRTG